MVGSRCRFGVALLLVMLPFAFASAPAAAATLDTATASGNNLIVDDFSSTEIEVDAHSGPLGENPGGTVSFIAGGILPVSGPVTCLDVSGNEAVMTVDGPFPEAPGFTAFLVRLVDNGGGGNDLFQFFPDDPEVPEDLDCRDGSPFWFGGTLVGRAIVSDAQPSPPVITGLEVVPSIFTVAGGAEINLTLSQDATVAFKVRRAPPLNGGGPPSKHTRRFKRELTAGANSVPFNGTIGNFTLRPGRYTLTARARNAIKQASDRVSTTFRIRP